MSDAALGIDLGGTNLRVCVVDREGRRLAETVEPVRSGLEAEALMAHVAGRAEALAGVQRLRGVGLAIAAIIGPDGRIGASNRPELSGSDAKALLAGRLKCPVSVENDARAALLGEARFGAARDVRNALMLTLGTGIGGGLLLDGVLRRGPRYSAGEIGLSLTPGGEDAAWVPLEDAASPGGLARVRGVGVVDVVERGGPAARELIGDIAERLAIAIVNAHALIDLEQVLLAGGLTGIGPPLLVAVRAAFGKLCPSELRHGLAIDYGALGIWAGAMGAAVPWLPKDQAR